MDATLIVLAIVARTYERRELRKWTRAAKYDAVGLVALAFLGPQRLASRHP